MKARNITVSRESIDVELQDGQVISVPLFWYPRLLNGTFSELNNWRLIGQGEGIHWPDLDEDISVANLLAGSRSGESQRSFERWLEARKPDARVVPLIGETGRLEIRHRGMFANEIELQGFFEQNLWKILHVRQLTSSRKGGGRVCNIDTLGVDDIGNIYIVEYKWDAGTAGLLSQMRQYERCLRRQIKDRHPRLPVELRNSSLNQKSIHLVPVAYRYMPNVLQARSDAVRLLRYSYARGAVIIRDVTDDSSEWPGERHPLVDKTGHMRRHLRKMSGAAQEAFWSLRDRILALGDVLEKPTGKKRVFYRLQSSNKDLAIASFSDVCVTWQFPSLKHLNDPEDRSTLVRTGSGPRFKCGMVSSADVEPVFGLLEQAYRRLCKDLET